MAVEKNPKVSVILPVYNCEKYLQYAIESILEQTFKDFEFIIINDGSTDQSREIIESYQKLDSRIKVINQKNQGLTKSLNKGISISKGDYIARMDADDISFPQRFEKQVAYLDSHPDVGLVGVWTEYFSDEVPFIGHSRFVGDSSKILQYLISHGNCFVHSSVMFRRKIIEKVGAYDKRLTKSQDYELWLRIATVTKLAFIPEILHRHRITVDSVSEKNAFETAKNNWIIKKSYYFRIQGAQDPIAKSLDEYKKKKFFLYLLFRSKMYYILGWRAGLRKDYKKASFLYLKSYILNPLNFKALLKFFQCFMNFGK